MTLLDKAKSVPIRRNGPLISTEEIELAVAWATGVVSLRQVKSAIETKHARNCYNWLAMALREAMKRGMLVKK